MTQALNLANFANNLNTGGATSNAGLQNSAVTVTAGTGLSGGGAVSLGGSVTLTNAAPDQTVVLTSGSGISVSGTYPNFTIATSGGGGVSSLNGQTGAITNTSFNAIGSYSVGGIKTVSLTVNAGDTYAGSNLYQTNVNNGILGPFSSFTNSSANTTLGQSGTWRALGKTTNGAGTPKAPSGFSVNTNLWVRIS